MRRTVLLALSAALAVLLSCGVALALNAVDCEGGGGWCVGTDRPDLMIGTRDPDAMRGHDGGDTLRGFGEGDALLGQKGDDKLVGGVGQDLLIGGADDDKLQGEMPLDIYYFERPDWGRDTISEESPSRNILRLPDGERFAGTVTTNMNPGPLPEVRSAGSGSTVNWRGDIVKVVIGSTGNDTVTGNDAANAVFDGEGREGDRDTISGAGGSDLLDVQDGAADDKVECGAGRDTVYFDQELELVFPDECEEKNPVPNNLESRRAMGYGAGAPGGALDGTSRDE